MGIVENKKEIRKEILKIRREMISKDKKIFDNNIQLKFFESNYYKNAKRIFIYISYNSEINTKEIIKRALKDKKEVYVPRTEVTTKSMDAVKIESIDNLIENKYGILEPREEEPSINPNELDLIVMPGVAFDKRGGRVGYGAGYYDRYLKKISKEKMGNINKVVLAYDFQVLESVPMDQHDESMDCIITEKGMFKLQK